MDQLQPAAYLFLPTELLHQVWVKQPQHSYHFIKAICSNPTSASTQLESEIQALSGFSAFTANKKKTSKQREEYEGLYDPKLSNKFLLHISIQ